MRNRLPSVGEFVFLVDVLIVGMLTGLVVISGINPFDSALMTGVLAAPVIVFATHHVWYTRHRQEIEHERERLAARERRGF
jgi:hypothetical protein